MQNVLIVDFNGTSAVYTHYFSKGLESNKTNVTILGKKKYAFLDVFSNLNKYITVNTGFKLLDYILNWLWLLLNYKKYSVIVIQWLPLLKTTSFEIKLVKYMQKKTKVIYILHNLYPHNSTNKKVINRYNFLYKNLINIAVHTKILKDKILELNPSLNVLEINHGLFFKEFRQERLPNANNKCLLIGYLSNYKGVEDALEVVSKLKEQNIIINLELIGLASPEYLKEIKKIVKYNKIEDQVVIISKEVSTKFLIDKINSAKMLWLPYKNISQSGVTYTSVGLKKPFVAYDVGNFKCEFGSRNVAEIVEKNNRKAFEKGVIKLLNNSNIYEDNISNNFKEDLWRLNNKILK